MTSSSKLTNNGWTETPEGWVNSNAPFTPALPEETALKIDKMLEEWESKPEPKVRDNGCWNPTAKTCDCPACGGFND
jgi:hypothetical protein